MRQPPIPGFPDYEITEDGRVWSKPRKDSRGETCGNRWMKAAPGSWGHLHVGLRKDGKYHRRYVHRLVLETFVGPCPDGMECCHNNGNPSDNRLESLRWDTHSANQYDIVRHGRHARVGICGEKHGCAKITETDARWIEYLRRAGVPRRELAEVYRISLASVSAIACHRNWAYLWRDER